MLVQSEDRISGNEAIGITDEELVGYLQEIFSYRVAQLKDEVLESHPSYIPMSLPTMQIFPRTGDYFRFRITWDWDESDQRPQLAPIWG